VTAPTEPLPEPPVLDAPAGPIPTANEVGFSVLGWVIAHPWWSLAIAVAVLFGLNYGIKKGWERLTLMYNIKGEPLAPLNAILKRASSLMLKEDITPVFTREPLRSKFPTFTWRRFWRWYVAVSFVAFALILVWPNQVTSTVLAVVGFVGLLGIGHVRKIFSYRHQLLMQMFEVANSELRYLRGAELNPWAYVQIQTWENVYYPGTTVIMYPAKFRSEDARNQSAFEQHFSSTVSNQHTWTYKWEPSQNRVVCEPVPFITKDAKYPFPDKHPWDEFPLGVAAGGEEAVWRCSVAPHALVAGTTGSGKALRLSQVIPTPSGWTTMGEIQVGDQVLDEQGKPCTVVGLSDINYTPDLYRVTFSDGSTIDADGDHLWWTETRQVRESRWNAARKTVTRRSLLSEERRDALRTAAAGMATDAEITVSEAAAIAGVSDSSTWVREVAANVGHIGELQVLTDFHYRAQVVTQTQKVTEYPARAVWSALAAYEPKKSAWSAARDTCAALAKAAGAKDVVSSQEVASVLGVAPKVASTTLRDRGVRGEVKKAGSYPVTMFPAREAWQALAEARSLGEVVPWLEKRPELAMRAAEARDGDAVTSVVVAEALGLSKVSGANGWLRRLGVQGTVVRRPVQLTIPEKTVRRESQWARTYPAAQLLEALAERGERAAFDQRHKRSAGGVRTTMEILATLRTADGHANHAVPVAQPLDLPEAELPVGPYTLGAWLGDGSSGEGWICGIDVEVARRVEAEAYQVIEKTSTASDHPDFRTWKVAGLSGQLRSAGVMRNRSHTTSQKHIPAAYLRASIAQRRALLAGLLDTDGTVAPQGTIQFTNTNRDLAFGVRELAVSLGYRATIVEGRAKSDGQDHGPKWTVSWTCAQSPFFLTRKTQAHQERNGSYNAQRNDFRYIVDVTPIDPVPARCLMVDSPNRLFLAGETMIPTHNSVTQRTMLLHALQSPEWRIVLVDPKRVELSAYRNHPNVLRVATELEDSLALIEQVEQEMQSRYVRMQESGVNHFKSLPTPPPAVLLMVDETFALLSLTGIKSDEGKEQDAMKARIGILLGDIARLGRAAGVHMILATQRPDAKVLSGELKANLDARIAQGRMDTTPSLMTLDSDAATKIPPIKGRAILREGNETTEFQAYFLPPDHLPMVLEMSAAIAQGNTGFLDEAANAQAQETVKESLGSRLRAARQARAEAREPREPRVRRAAADRAAGGSVQERLAGWWQRRREVMEENERRAGRDPAQEVKPVERAPRKRVTREQGPAAAAPSVEVEVPLTVGDVATQAKGRGVTAAGSDLFVAARTAGRPPVPVVDPFSVDPEDELAEFDDFVDEDVVDDGLADDLAFLRQVSPATAASDVVQAPVEVPPAPVVPEPPVAPVAVQPGAPVSVEEVMRRAAARGVAIPASELLAALRAEAAMVGGPAFPSMSVVAAVPPLEPFVVPAREPYVEPEPQFEPYVEPEPQFEPFVEPEPQFEPYVEPVVSDEADEVSAAPELSPSRGEAELAEPAAVPVVGPPVVSAPVNIPELPVPPKIVVPPMPQMPLPPPPVAVPPVAVPPVAVPPVAVPPVAVPPAVPGPVRPSLGTPVSPVAVPPSVVPGVPGPPVPAPEVSSPAGDGDQASREAPWMPSQIITRRPSRPSPFGGQNPPQE
jgi:hypothetical protein